MNVTRNVMTDLLPVYFSGEASEDTRQLMEQYFRDDPDFERIARSAATPLDILRKAAPVAPNAEREKRDLQWARAEVARRRIFFGAGLLFTLAPVTSAYSKGHLVWAAMLNDHWSMAVFWILGALFWFQYFARLSRRTSALVFGVFLTLLPLVSAFHLFQRDWRADLSLRLIDATVTWFFAAVIWANYLRLGRRKRGSTGR